MKKRGPKTLPYKKARKISRGVSYHCNLTTAREWREFVRNNELPAGIRKHPNRIYKDFDWKDWLADDLRRSWYKKVGMQVLGNLKIQGKSMAWLARKMGCSRELVRQKLSGAKGKNMHKSGRACISNEDIKLFKNLGLM